MFQIVIIAIIQLVLMIVFSVFMKVCIEYVNIELSTFAKTGKFPKYANPFILKVGNIYYEYGKSSDSNIMFYNFFWPFLLVHYIIIALYMLVMREPKENPIEKQITGGCAAPRGLVAGYGGANPELFFTFTKEKSSLIKYKCANCGNTCLANIRPDNSVCGGCDSPNWKIMKIQESFEEGQEDWMHPEGEI